MPSRARAPYHCCITAALGAAAGLATGGQAAAQVPVERLSELFAHSPRLGTGSGWIVGSERLRALAVSPALLPGTWLPLGERHWVLRVPEAERAAYAQAGAWRWSPPRHLLMDRARGAVRLDVARAAGAGSGQGVVIGVVDSGVDASHPDLRNPDGSTRLAWWLDFASNPAGTHPELEAALGCQPQAGLRCQVLDADELNERLDNSLVGDEPRDPLGHGTIVAAIAAGNGAGAGGALYAGMAPEATLIAARVTGPAGDIQDSDVVLASRFVFERAEELGLPAVVNLSLGSDFGAHDADSDLAAALAELVGPEHPGRALVLAAGNSGELFHGMAQGVPEPFGIHTEVTVQAGEPLSVPLVTPYPAHGGSTTDASLFIWLDLYPPGSLSVGIQLPDGTRLEPQALDQSRVLDAGELVVGALNGLGTDAEREATLGELPELPIPDVWPTQGSAVVLVDGRWPAGRGFTIELEGEGHAELWVQSEGDLSPGAGSVGALFAGATARGTVAIPAAHPELIAVGASVDRVDWSDVSGAPFSVASLPVTPPPELGAAVFFSAAGPNADGRFKPELLAPGAFVISAMSAAADPRRGGVGIFAGLCGTAACQVVAERYALTAGTSMAAPMVSGAAALLLERQPSLTQAELRGLLITGSSTLGIAPDAPGRGGAGLLDVARSLEASGLGQRPAEQRPSPETSRLEAAADSIAADATRSLEVLVWLRDAEQRAFDASLERLSASVSGGSLAEPLRRAAPGLYALALRADASAGTLELALAVDGQAFASLALPVEGGARSGARADDDGGCSLPAARAPGRAAGWSTLGLLGLLGLRGVRLRRRFTARSGTP